MRRLVHSVAALSSFALVLTAVPGTAAADKTLVFVAEQDHKVIAIFDARGRKLREIHTDLGPLAADTDGNLFVAPVGLPYLYEFHRPYDGPPTKIYLPSNPAQAVQNVAVDQKTGVLAVFSYTYASPNYNIISFYQPRASYPCNVFSGPEPVGSSGAFDAEGNLFYETLDRRAPIESLAGECSAGFHQFTPFMMAEPPPAMDEFLAFDSDDRLVVQVSGGRCDGKPALVETYPHPRVEKFRHGTIGPPIAATLLAPHDKCAPFVAALTSDGGHLWASETIELRGSVLEYRYPAAGPSRPVNAIVGIPNPRWVTVTPPLTP